jgi:uncharacterized protein (DUF2147 family)
MWRRAVVRIAVGGLIVASLGAVNAAQAPNLSPVGSWRTIDDKTGQAKSIVRIVEAKGEVQASVESVFSPPAVSAAPICDKCSGDLKNKPIVGMTIMWGMKKDGGEFSGGRVLDPDEGKVYRCTIKVIEGGNKLEVRGYIGFSLFGRTQTWVREPS